MPTLEPNSPARDPRNIDLLADLTQILSLAHHHPEVTGPLRECVMTLNAPEAVIRDCAAHTHQEVEEWPAGDGFVSMRVPLRTERIRVWLTATVPSPGSRGDQSATTRFRKAERTALHAVQADEADRLADLALEARRGEL